MACDDELAVKAFVDGCAVLTIGGRAVSLTDISYENLEGDGLLNINGTQRPVHVTLDSVQGDTAGGDYDVPPAYRRVWMKFKS